MLDHVLICPSCAGEANAPLTDGRVLCLNADCRHEWDPAEPQPEADDIATQVARARERFIGREVMVHDVEHVGTVTAVDDDGYATIEFGSGYYVWLEPDEFSLIEDDGIPNAVVAAIASTDFAAMAQMLRAGAETIDAQDEAIKLGMAPDGWLPMDGDVMPVIEHAISYLIAWLAITYQIPKQQLLDSADAFEDAARAAGDAQ